ncbi:uncharacterized protein At3g61260-like [Phalaenopsis equestris]|uniref:uncharacterized protein At3g61260-like n=1 Tax=Phalaenopsis equestris TaxID=78828 RepID=UPI0009E6219C|nr:uncharacterized protein At3g61260-like [Phalaenopsis equestris]
MGSSDSLSGSMRGDYEGWSVDPSAEFSSSVVKLVAPLKAPILSATEILTIDSISLDLGANPFGEVITVDQVPAGVSFREHDASASTVSETAFNVPPTTVKSVSMRDMGTEMTPIASQEPSQTGTPVRATTPSRSPSSSRPSTPPRTATTIESADFCREKELRIRTRREIMVLGTQLGKMNITAWASKEEEETDASVNLKMDSLDQQPNNVVEARAAAWEEAEKAKYLARFKREEIKIQAWENHQKAKTEAEMRKVEDRHSGRMIEIAK